MSSIDTLEEKAPSSIKEKTPYRRLMDSLPWRFFRKLAMMQIVVTSLIIVTTAWMARYYLNTYITTQAKEQLKESLQLIRQSIETQKISPISWCNSLKLNWGTRYTLVNAQGTVLCDNWLKPEDMGNQHKYPEIQDALRFGHGTHTRFSQADQTNLIFGAIAIDSVLDGLKQRFLIRQAVPLNKLDTAMKELDNSIIIFLFPLLIITSLVSLWGSMQVSFPLRSILKKVDKMKRVTNAEDVPYLTENGDEWSIVEKTLEKAQEGLEHYLDELHNENEKMGTVMESITDSILAIGLHENILFANKQFKKNFLNKDVKRKEISKFKIWEITRNMDLQNLFNDCLMSNDSVKKKNMELPIKGGKRTSYFDIKVNPLFDQNGNIFGAVGVFHDVTERKLAEQMREDFVANVSHEVRTPLTAMKGYVQILKDAPDDSLPQNRGFLDRIEQNSDRLTHLFNDILNLSVIESKNKVEKFSIDAADITNSVISNVKLSYLEKNIEIESNIEVEKIWANPQLLEQVLTNLIDNAFKYTPEGGKVCVSWTENLENKVAIFKVKDTGLGIPKEHLPRLFERFYRVDPSRSREMGGTGLGLAIVKHIINTHSGNISVESKPEKGTTFIVKLPAHY